MKRTLATTILAVVTCAVAGSCRKGTQPEKPLTTAPHVLLIETLWSSPLLVWSLWPRNTKRAGA
jgi:hypothetical protein